MRGIRSLQFLSGSHTFCRSFLLIIFCFGAHITKGPSRWRRRTTTHLLTALSQREEWTTSRRRRLHLLPSKSLQQRRRGKIEPVGLVFIIASVIIVFLLFQPNMSSNLFFFPFCYSTTNQEALENNRPAIYQHHLEPPQYGSKFVSSLLLLFVLFVICFVRSICYLLIVFHGAGSIVRIHNFY